MAHIDRQYHKLLHNILRNGFIYDDPNRRDIKRYQIPHATIKHDFKDGFPALTTKKLAWKSVVGETLWMLKGDTNIKYLLDNNIPIWNKDALNYANKHSNHDYDMNTFLQKVKYEEFINYHMKFGDVGRNYGAQMRNWIGIDNIEYPDSTIKVDQLANLIHTLKINPLATKKTVTYWNPAELENTALSPCHWSFEILVEPLTYKQRCENNSNEKSCLINRNDPKYQFTLKFHMGSVDTFLGLPFDLGYYGLLAHILGKMVNMVPKGIIADLSNVHIYEPHLDAVKEQLGRDVDKYDNCELEINSEIDNILSGYIKNEAIPLDIILNNIGIPDFALDNYESYPRIPAEMLPYNK